MRGVTAQELHGQLRHMYITVDNTATNWHEYLYEKINRLPYGGVLHILDHTTLEEIERMYI